MDKFLNLEEGIFESDGYFHRRVRTANCQSVTVLGEKYSFKQTDTLEPRYLSGLVSSRSGSSAGWYFKKYPRKKCGILLDPIQEANPPMHASLVCAGWYKKPLCTNPNKIIWAVLDNPIAMNGVIFAFIESNHSALDDAVYLLIINQVFAAHDLNKDVNFATRWSRHVGRKGSSTLDAVFDKSNENFRHDKFSTHVYCPHCLHK